MTSLTIFAPAGVELRAPALKLAKQRLGALGFDVSLDPSVRARHQRFAGDDATRLETIHRVARRMAWARRCGPRGPAHRVARYPTTGSRS